MDQEQLMNKSKEADTTDITNGNEDPAVETNNQTAEQENPTRENIINDASSTSENIPDADNMNTGESGSDNTSGEQQVLGEGDKNDGAKASADVSSVPTAEASGVETGNSESPKEEQLKGSDAMEVEEGACSSNEGASSNSVEGASSNSLAPMQSVYHVKWINFKGQQVGIITQNENGPCPLLAIMNILLLQGKVKLPGMLEIVSSGQLMEYLGDCIFEHAPKNINEESRLNYEQNMSDAMAVFHKLQTGLDVNVKFTGVTDFEYTPECIVFDLLNIQLIHGWLVDPQNSTEVNAVGNCSYNQLVEKIITQKNSANESQVREALCAEEFLNKTSHQLTYHGLCMLANHFKDSQLAVLFRNNHFSTLLKHRDELLVLVTDQGFLTESNVVWETLSNVEGDGHFIDGEFRTYRKPETSTTPVTIADTTPGSPQQVDQDYLVALSLQQETQEQPTTETLDTAGLSDHELALKLQEEENRQLTLLQQQQEQQQRRQQQAARNQQLLSEQYMQQQQEQRKKNDSCTIL